MFKELRNLWNKYPAIVFGVVVVALFIGYKLYQNVKGVNTPTTTTPTTGNQPAQIYAFDVTPPAPGTNTPTPNSNLQTSTRRYGLNPVYDNPGNLTRGLPLFDSSGNNTGFYPFSTPIQLLNSTIVNIQGTPSYQTTNGSYIHQDDTILWPGNT